jgi:hypothetical protein
MLRRVVIWAGVLGIAICSSALAEDKKAVFCAVAGAVVKDGFSLAAVGRAVGSREQQKSAKELVEWAFSKGLTPQEAKIADAYALEFIQKNQQGMFTLALDLERTGVSLEQASSVLATLVIGNCMRDEHSPAQLL